ncbi:hypothetical protein [Bradyrhizobium sp. Ash2021]|uniref:hypothetical protein n=1 Tax=Bradyrhizobium sp. Ash2021 TaxID=2954771 RepID=UPI0028157760|nr:hypothetical protein [Bradyrhizobium sp. Ash2021]WMT76314.1 hypothetical protein NL528_08080 [Bradyrhizobium sp. Ash2021]
MDADAFLMIVMFFVTPPALSENRPWTLQSTQSSEFTSWDACNDVIEHQLIPAMQTTDTVALVGWCVPKAFKGKARNEVFNPDGTSRSDRRLLIKQFAQDPAKKKEFGSCYSFVPGSGVTTRVLGQCENIRPH